MSGFVKPQKSRAGVTLISLDNELPISQTIYSSFVRDREFREFYARPHIVLKQSNDCFTRFPALKLPFRERICTLEINKLVLKIKKCSCHTFREAIEFLLCGKWHACRNWNWHASLWNENDMTDWLGRPYLSDNLEKSENPSVIQDYKIEWFYPALFPDCGLYFILFCGL